MQIWMEVVIGVLVLMRSKTSAQTGYSLVGTFLDSVLDKKKGEASLAKAFEFFQDGICLEMCFPRGGGKLTLNCLPYPVPIPCHRRFFFHSRGWAATLSLHSDWPCPGLLCHSWCPLAPAESSFNWPRLRSVRIDYMVMSVPMSFHLSGSWCSLAPAESSLKWPRLHLV